MIIFHERGTKKSLFSTELDPMNSQIAWKNFSLVLTGLRFKKSFKIEFSYSFAIIQNHRWWAIVPMRPKSFLGSSFRCFLVVTRYLQGPFSVIVIDLFRVVLSHVFPTCFSPECSLSHAVLPHVWTDLGSKQIMIIKMN